MVGVILSREKQVEQAGLSIFISHANANRTFAGRLKKSLQHCGVRAFLAHDDIETGEEWDEDILRELGQCDVFLVILTEEAKNSQYVNQEIGFALAREVPIIPLKNPLNPWCFISSIQGMEPEYDQRMTDSGMKRYVNFHDTSIAIVKKLMRRENLHSVIRGRILIGLKKSANVVETAAKIRLLKTCESFNDTEACEIINAVLCNENVSGSYAVPPLIKRLRKENPDVFEEEHEHKLLEKGVLKTDDLVD